MQGWSFDINHLIMAGCDRRLQQYPPMAVTKGALCYKCL